MHGPNQAAASTEHWVVSSNNIDSAIRNELVNHSTGHSFHIDNLEEPFPDTEHHSDPPDLPMKDLHEVENRVPQKSSDNAFLSSSSGHEVCCPVREKPSV